jgi:hypothetical protein
VPESSESNKAALPEQAKTAEQVQRFGSSVYARYAGFPPNVPLAALMARRFAFDGGLPLAESILQRWSVSGRQMVGLPVLKWRHKVAGYRSSPLALPPTPLKTVSRDSNSQAAGDVRSSLPPMDLGTGISPGTGPGPESLKATIPFERPTQAPAPSISRAIAAAPGLVDPDTPEGGHTLHQTHLGANAADAELGAGHIEHQAPAQVSHELPAQKQKVLPSVTSLSPEMGPPIFRRVSLPGQSAAISGGATPAISGSAPSSGQKALRKENASESFTGNTSPVNLAAPARAQEEVHPPSHAICRSFEAAPGLAPPLPMNHVFQGPVAVSRFQEAIIGTPPERAPMLQGLDQARTAKAAGQNSRIPEQSSVISEVSGAQPFTARPTIPHAEAARVLSERSHVAPEPQRVSTAPVNLLPDASRTVGEPTHVVPEPTRVLRVAGEAGGGQQTKSGSTVHQQRESPAAHVVLETPGFTSGRQPVPTFAMRGQELASSSSAKAERQTSPVERKNETDGNNARTMISPAASAQSFSPHGGDGASAATLQAAAIQVDRRRGAAMVGSGSSIGSAGESRSGNARATIVHAKEEAGPAILERRSSPVDFTPVHAASVSDDIHRSSIVHTVPISAHAGAEPALQSAASDTPQSQMVRGIVVRESALARMPMEPAVAAVHTIANAGMWAGREDAPRSYARAGVPPRGPVSQPIFSDETTPRVSRSSLTHRVFTAADRLPLHPSSAAFPAAQTVVERQAAIDSPRAASSKSFMAPAVSRAETNGVVAGPGGTDLARLANSVYELLVRRLASERQRRGR